MDAGPLRLTMRTCVVLLLAGCAPAAARPPASPADALPPTACYAPRAAPAEDGRRATNVDSGSVVPLRTVPPADSVVARRAGATILLSAADVDAYLTDFLQRHRLAPDRALLERVRQATRQAGWAELAAESGQDRMREDFLLAALLERGQAAVRDRSGTTVRQVCLHRVGTHSWWGRRFVLPDGTTLLEVVDIVI
jgi:hypothetical protein